MGREMAPREREKKSPATQCCGSVLGFLRDDGRNGARDDGPLAGGPFAELVDAHVGLIEDQVPNPASAIEAVNAEVRAHPLIFLTESDVQSRLSVLEASLKQQTCRAGLPKRGPEH